MSSISSAKHISSVHESDPKFSIEKDIEPKIAPLKNSLAPDTLIKVLESTTEEKCLNGEGFFFAVISRFVEHCRLVEAKRVFAAMVAGGCKPVVDTVNVLLSALVNAKRELGEVLFVYKEMVKAGTLPNVGTLNYLIEALCEADRADLACFKGIAMWKT
ncbi:hypothetical protein QQ045_021769 [Rhodiola kirilowii]